MLAWKISLIVLSTLMNTYPNANLYPTVMTVIEVNDAEDRVIFENSCGYKYPYAGAEDWAEGDTASCLMCDVETELIFDDFILAAKYEDLERQYVIEYIPVYVQGEELTDGDFEAELIS